MAKRRPHSFFGYSLRRRRCQTQGNNLVSLASQDFVTEALKIKYPSRLWNCPRFEQNQPRNGRRLVVRQGPIEFPIEVAYCYSPVNQVGAIRLRSHATNDLVVLIVNFPKNFFHYIFHS